MGRQQAHLPELLGRGRHGLHDAAHALDTEDHHQRQQRVDEDLSCIHGK